MLTLLLFATGLFAGTVDAIAGGGGLISLPVLLSIGMPPHIALGTNKLQGVVGTLMAAKRYSAFGFVSFKSVRIGIVFGVLGALCGAVLTQVIDPGILKKMVPPILIAILLYTICKPKLGLSDIHPRMNQSLFYIIFGFLLGFYDGFMGPATGSFWVFLLAFFLGYNLIKASAYTKVLNLNSSLVALSCFVVAGNVDYHAGLIMAAGQLIGGRLGAGLAISKGIKLVRPLFLCVVSSSIATLVYKGYLHDDIVIVTSFAKQHQYMPLMVMVGALLVLSFVASTAYQNRTSAQEERKPTHRSV